MLMSFGHKISHTRLSINYNFHVIVRVENVQGNMQNIIDKSLRPAVLVFSCLISVVTFYHLSPFRLER